MDHWILQNPAVLYQMACFSDEAPPFSADETLWRTSDITTGLDVIAEQPTNEEVMEQLLKRCRELGRCLRQSFFRCTDRGTVLWRNKI